MDKNKSITTLQTIVTALSRGAFILLVQGKHFRAMGLKKLGEKYEAHYAEEMNWVEKFIARMNDLGATVKIEAQEASALTTDAIAYISQDLSLQQTGVEVLYNLIPTLSEDPTTYDLLKAYLADEEEDLYWLEEQKGLIEMIGKQNWFAKQF